MFKLVYPLILYMKLPVNEGKTDRIIRVALGMISIVLAIILYFTLNAPLDLTLLIILLIIGSVSLITGITGFCGLYKLFGISTVKES